jgi:hypothetical protein
MKAYIPYSKKALPTTFLHYTHLQPKLVLPHGKDQTKPDYLKFSSSDKSHEYTRW